MSDLPVPALLTSPEIAELLGRLPGWSVSADGTAISNRFSFANFEVTIGFVNRLAMLANARNHHPELRVGYDYCEVLFTTHAAGGLTELDAQSARAAHHLAKELNSVPTTAGVSSWGEVPDEIVNPSMTRRIVTGER